MNALSGPMGVVLVVLGAIGLLIGVVYAGFLLAQRRKRKAAPAKRRVLPRQWPLNPRPLASTAERRVWHWLHNTFPEHHVLPKLPLTRFTMPREPGQGNEWFEMLSGAYCSFTICNDEARVVGCVDVLGPRGISRANRHLKQTLLGQCGIGYWVLSHEALPAPEVLRTEFLGAAGEDSLPPSTESHRLDSMRQHLHEMLDRNRGQRYHQALSQNGNGPDADVTPWPQPNSFLGALDSRTGSLK
ncbi:MAG: DUF2726 domain-containing protein [Pseudomonadota bacterium]|nr:DUF2726 domain-containing protein [Pseudomonadota bacterium]